MESASELGADCVNAEGAEEAGESTGGVEGGRLGFGDDPFDGFDQAGRLRRLRGRRGISFCFSRGNRAYVPSRSLSEIDFAGVFG